MRFDPKVRYLFIGAVLAFLTALIAPATTEACDFGGGAELEAFMPADGAEIPGDAEFSIWRSKRPLPELDFELVGAGGQSRPLDVERTATGTGGIGQLEHLTLSPRSRLEPGTYRLEQTTGAGEDTTGGTSRTFEVVGQNLQSPPAPETLHWTRAEAPVTTCHPDRSQWHEITIETGYERDDVWYEIEYRGPEGDVRASQPSKSALRHHVQHPAECVAVTAVSLDGTRSETVETCTPDVCREFDGPGEYSETDCTGPSGDSTP